jgi:ABC-type polar amino acid transport system ATPase subunit
LAGTPLHLLIGKKRSGKTTVGRALEILQKIARGTNRVGELIDPQDFAQGRTDIPIRFESLWHLVAFPILQQQSSIESTQCGLTSRTSRARSPDFFPVA